MTTKRILAIMLSLALALGMLAGCGGDSGELREPVNSSPAETEGTDAATEPKKDEPVTIAETVLYEKDGVKVTATGLENGWMGPEVKFLLENTSERSVLITTDAVSVNGCMAPFSGLYAEVAAGKKSNESMTLMSSELERSGIETIAQLQFFLEVKDADSWDPLDTSPLLTLSTSAADFRQPADDSGQVLYDEGGIRVICKGLKQDLIWDGTIVFFMENNSGQPITVSAENVSVNGFMEEAGLWSDLRDGTWIIDGMSLLDLSDLELESIDEVQTIEFELRIINSDSWKELVTTDPITLNFE